MFCLLAMTTGRTLRVGSILLAFDWDHLHRFGLMRSVGQGIEGGDGMCVTDPCRDDELLSDARYIA